MRYGISICLVLLSACSTRYRLNDEDQGVYECSSPISGNPVHYFDSRDDRTEFSENVDDGVSVTFTDMNTGEEVTLYEEGHDFYDCVKVSDDSREACACEQE